MRPEDVLAKYGGKPYPPLEKTTQQEKVEIVEYNGLTEYSRSSRNPRFRIVDKMGNSYGCGYAHLLGWLFTPPDIMTLQTTTHIFTIEGKGLEILERALMDEKVKEIREYSPTNYRISEENTVMIEKIAVVNRFENQV